MRRLSVVAALLVAWSASAGAAAPPAVGAAHGMVACAQKLACEVGVDVLKQGGNAVDAAVG